MGAGKTTVCQELKKLLPPCAFLDGDWCWDMEPFLVTEETKAMVQENIVFLLRRFLACSAYENVIFSWVMHDQAILDAILSRLDRRSCRTLCVSLLTDEETLRARLEADIARGLRTPDVIGRSLDRLPLYAGLSTHKLDTTGKTVPEVAAALRALEPELPAR